MLYEVITDVAELYEPLAEAEGLALRVTIAGPARIPMHAAVEAIRSAP